MSILSLRTPIIESASHQAPVRSLHFAGSEAARRVSSQSLLDGARELVIQHQGGEYHLRLTRNDKLILTK